MKLTSKELIKSVTKSWEGKRDKNYRPLVSKDILKRMKLVTTEEAWGTCRKNGYHFQFAGDIRINCKSCCLPGKSLFFF